VAIARFVGDISGAALLAHLRALSEEAPRILSYGSIVDVRRWVGVLVDDDLAAQYVWIKDFQRRHGVRPDPLPHLAYLCDDVSAGARTLARFARVRRDGVSLVTGVEEAWSAVAPGRPMPQEVKKFMAKR